MRIKLKWKYEERMSGKREEKVKIWAEVERKKRREAYLITLIRAHLEHGRLWGSSCEWKIICNSCNGIYLMCWIGVNGTNLTAQGMGLVVHHGTPLAIPSNNGGILGRHFLVRFSIFFWVCKALKPSWIPYPYAGSWASSLVYRACIRRQSWHLQFSYLSPYM